MFLSSCLIYPVLFVCAVVVSQAGVAAIALGTQEKYDIKVPIVPIGLTYFR